MRSRGLILIISTVFYLLYTTSCEKDFGGYYDPPKDMKGPIYEQLKSDPEFSEFVAAIDKFPSLRNDINTSGLYTVFAPTNDAIKTFLAAKYPAKKSINDFDIHVPSDSVVLNELVQMHIIFNMYFEYDFNKAVDILTKPNVLGPVNSSDVYRYTSRYKDSKYLYFDKVYKKNRFVEPDYKKITVYSSNFLSKYNLASDYQSLFGIEPQEFNVDGAQVTLTKKDISAKNGVIHAINKVLERLPYMDELIAQKNPVFYNLLEQFANLQFKGLTLVERDSLFTKWYGGVPLQSDLYDFTFLCPSGNGFMDFINNQVLPGYDNSFDSIQPVTSALILNTYFISSFSNSTNLQKSALNGAGDTLTNLVFADKSRASNGVLYTVQNEIRSSAFSSVVKVPLLNKKYSMFLTLLTQRMRNGFPSLFYDNIYYLKNLKRSFTLVVPSNSAFVDAGITLSKDYKGFYDFFQGGSRLLSTQQDSILNSLIIPNVSVEPGQMNYKWSATRGNNYMLFKNGKIQGSIDYANSESTSNGYVYTTEELPSRPTISVGALLKDRTGYKIFVDSILSVYKWNGQTFLDMLKNLNTSDSYTVFIPSDTILTRYKKEKGLGYFSKDTTWRVLATYHIINTKLFGDGTFLRKPGNPTPEDDSRFVTLYAKEIYNSIFIKNVYAWLQFSFNGSKTITSEDGVTSNIIYPFDLQGANGVIHSIDKLLVPPPRKFY